MIILWLVSWLGCWIGCRALCRFAAGVCPGPASRLYAEEPSEDVWRLRNLGQAYYETPGQSASAVEVLRSAVALDPGSAVDRYNLGIALLAAGSRDDGIEQLQIAQQADASFPNTWYRLGLVYEEVGRFADAIDQFSGLLVRRRDEPAAHLRLGLLRQATGDVDKARDHLEAAALLDPLWAAPHFHLAGLHQAADRPLEADEEMLLFRSLEGRRRGARVDGDPLDHPLAGFYELLEARHSIVEAPAAGLRFRSQTLARDLPEAGSFLRLMDVDNDGGSDLWVVTPYRVTLFADGATPRPTALDGVKGLVDLSAGDFNQDGLLDLCVVGPEGAALWRNTGGDFVPHEAALPGGRFDQSLWFDYDHDGYLDLLLFGHESALVRNSGDGTFIDRTAGFPFVQGWVHSAAVLERPFDGPGSDLVVVYRERRGVLYRDRLGGDFEPKALLNVPLALGSLVAGDLNNDGYFDLAGGNPSMAALFLNDLQAGFRRAGTPPSSSGPVLFVDLAGRGVIDLVAGGLVFPNRGLGRVSTGRALNGWPRLLRAAVWADFDADGRADVAALGEGGRLVLLYNETPHRPGLRIQLSARRPLQGTVVEVRMGPRYQQQMYRGIPLVMALGSAEKADFVRIRWPDGSRHYAVDVASGSELRLEGPSVASPPPPPQPQQQREPSPEAPPRPATPSADDVDPADDPAAEPVGEPAGDPVEPSSARSETAEPADPQPSIDDDSTLSSRRRSQ